jgi:hypothetical protein
LLEERSSAIDSFLKEMAKTRIGAKSFRVSNVEGGVFSFDVGDEFLVLAHIIQ